MTFLILVKAIHNGRVLDEALLEFPVLPGEKKLERELHFAEWQMRKNINLKNLLFSFVPVRNVQEGKRSKLWNYRGTHILVR